MVDYPLLSHGITRQTKNYCSKGHTNFLIEALDGDIRMCKVRCIYKWQKANKKTRKIIRRARVCSPTSVGTMNERLSKINGWTRKLLWKNILFEVYMPTLPSQWVKSLFWRRVLYTLAGFGIGDGNRAKPSAVWFWLKFSQAISEFNIRRFFLHDYWRVRYVYCYDHKYEYVPSLCRNSLTSVG